jgi:hypothetical protein
VLINNFETTTTKDLERVFFDVIGTEIDKIGQNELIAAIKHNSVKKQKLGLEIPRSGCRFCTPQADEMQPYTEREFE